MDLSLRSIKTNNWSEDYFKKTRCLNELYTWARDTVMWNWWVDILFDNCQSTITWMSYKNVHYQVKYRHLASNARSLQENNARLAANQSARTIVAIW